MKAKSDPKALRTGIPIPGWEHGAATLADPHVLDGPPVRLGLSTLDVVPARRRCP